MLRANVQKNVKWSAHYDGHKNVILQLIGIKTWLLFEPSVHIIETFPPGHPSVRHSAIDFADPTPENKQYVENLVKMHGRKITLEPGMVLVVPPFWTHFTISDTPNLSINWFSG